VQACEQTFSWLSSYKSMARHFGRERFMFFLTHVCHLRNLRIERKMESDGRLAGIENQANSSLLLVPDGKNNPHFKAAKVQALINKGVCELHTLISLCSLAVI
jgi:hypothetical protein